MSKSYNDPLYELLPLHSLLVQREELSMRGKFQYVLRFPLKIRGKDEYMLIFPGEKLVYTHFSGGGGGDE